MLEELIKINVLIAQKSPGASIMTDGTNYILVYKGLMNEIDHLATTPVKETSSSPVLAQWAFSNLGI